MVNSAAPPLWVRGQSGGPCKENLRWAPRGQKSQQEELRGDGGERGSRGDFSLSLESESGSNLVLIAVFMVFFVSA